MAAETPFGASFGDPRRYMGQSPLAEVGRALKTGAILYGLQKSGVIGALDKMGVKPNAQGGFGYQMPKPAGAVAPTTQPMSPQPVAPQLGAVPPAAIPQAPSVQVTPLGQEAPSNVQINTFAPPPDAGRQILEGTFRPQSSAVDVQNETDFSPLAPDTSNQFAVSGNDYQQIPGYGKLQRIAGQFMGMG
jgi:hypothetical protein